MLGLAAVVAGVGPVLEGRERGPEQAARAYLAAVERGDLDGALATIDPTRRSELRERVAWQLGNRYEPVTLVLGRPSMLVRLAANDGRDAWITVLADVTGPSGERWRSTSTAEAVLRDGRWYLARPLFA